MLTARTLQYLGIILLAAFLGIFSYRAGANAVRVEWQRAEIQYAQTLATLAHQYAQADAEAARARAERDRVARETNRRVEDAIAALPPRDCGWTSDEHRVLQDAYCSIFPTAPACKLP